MSVHFSLNKLGGLEAALPGKNFKLGTLRSCTSEAMFGPKCY